MDICKEIEKSLIMPAEAVKSVLAGKKTQIRIPSRINPGIKCDEGFNNHEFVRDDFDGRFKYTGYVCRHCGLGVCHPHSKYPTGTSFLKPPCDIGDVIYVKEPWNYGFFESGGGEFPDEPEMHFSHESFKAPSYIKKMCQFVYKADYLGEEILGLSRWNGQHFMPKRAARLFLKITDIRLERVQNISDDDLKKEGVESNISEYSPIEYFKECIWENSLSEKASPYYGWDLNPWVWVVSFEIAEKTR